MIKSNLLLAFLMVLFSCKKEKNEASLSNTGSFRLKFINKSWKSASFKEDGVNYDKWCHKNSIYNFYEDGWLYITEGDNEGACFGSVIGRVRKYNYTLNESSNDLIVKYQQGVENEIDSFKIVTITPELMKLQRKVNKTSMPPGQTWEDEFIRIQ